MVLNSSFLLFLNLKAVSFSHLQKLVIASPIINASLNLKAVSFSHLQKLVIASPIINTSLISLHQSPPHVHHYPLYSRAFQRLQTRVHSFPPIHSVPSREAVQRHHYVYRNSLTFLHGSLKRRRRFKENRWDSRMMLGSGGMSSSHSATVSALAVAIGLQEGAGVGAPTFVVALVLACVVMYDASGVRLHAGRQAELLNQIVCELPPEHPVSNIRSLRDSIGHTPLQLRDFGCDRDTVS
ncbi:hypothetical protein K2173_000464 [Erythroxylum novogranatense]|uniref:Acid phosphatase/vanadium-dependent haloperoxidase-related protein n=1 Tax=Erythroxylum novogranatense TaxID=1862640 RepID=A0AAV8SWR0_9ROSI|nr:hypothetical protein K2173_000464 [Erythroxylum novogranatense]